uniref:Uncharacterized protein n=1 Tax=Hyaloperonospora arabidopsidis (strain Emoy2) TaxID=559515 RepID=M4BLE5_HYAAE
MSVRGPNSPMPDRGEAECASGTANQSRAPSRSPEGTHMNVGAPSVDTPSPKSSSPAGVWDPARVSTLRQSFQPHASAQKVLAETDVCPRAALESEEHEHRILYECARGEYCYRMDGLQRDTSSAEEQTLMAWLKGESAATTKVCH